MVLVVGLGYLAVFKIPGWLSKYVLPRIPEKYTEKFVLAMVIALAAGLATLVRVCIRLDGTRMVPWSLHLWIS